MDKIDWYGKFWSGWTIFHAVGLILIIWGSYLAIEPATGSGFGVELSLQINGMQIAGILSYFFEAVKAIPKHFRKK